MAIHLLCLGGWLWGGGDRDYILALAINGDEIYAGGYTWSSASWDTAGSTVGTFTSDVFTLEGFVVEIADGGPPTLEWRMWIGGTGNDVVTSLAINGDEIYAGGYSPSSAIWDTAGSTVGTFTNAGANQGFIVEIADGGPPSLEWRMWHGPAGAIADYELVVSGDAIFAVNFAGTSSSMETFTTVSGALFAQGNDGAFLAEITDGGPPTYFWLQWLTGSGASSIGALAVNGDEIYAGGSSYAGNLGTVISVGTPNGYQEGFVIEIADGSTPSLNWSVLLGGTGASAVYALTVNGDEIYAGGYTDSSASWDTAGSVVGTLTNTLASGNEGFVVEIADGSPPSLAWRMWLGGVGVDQVLVLAINGNEVYAAGLTWSSASWDTAAETVGTFTNADVKEGFVVEIADSGPPTVAWRMWLGGQNTEQVHALVVNGDEIYAGGYSFESAPWETAGSIAGTWTNSGTGQGEGYIVEIADGSPPTLSWLMWVGGVAVDLVYTLAINEDEIYAAGYTWSSDSWDTAGSTVGTLTNTLVLGEGYVVEVTDGGPPSLAWRMWLGGVGADVVYTLSVNGDEIYAGGYTDSSASWDTAVSVKGTFTNAAVTEGFVVEIADGGPPSLNYLMWLGGLGADQVLAMAINGDEIYAGGYIPSTAANEGVFSGTKYDVQNSAFIVEIADDATAAVMNALFWLD